MSVDRGGPEKPQSIWTRNFASIFAANILLNLGLLMTNGILPKYTEHLGASAVEIGLVTSLFSITALLFKVVAGPAIDSCNRKLVLAAAVGVMAVAFVGYAGSSSIQAVSAFSLLRGVSQAFTVTCGLAIATDFLPTERLAAGLGVYSLGQAVCQAAGPFLSLNLALVIGYQNTLLLAALVEVLGLTWVLLIKGPNKGAMPFRISLDRVLAKEALLPVLAMTLIQLSFFSIVSFLVVCGIRVGVPQSHIGLYFAVQAGILVVLRPIVGGFADKHGCRRAISPGLLVYAWAFIVLSQASTLGDFLIAAVFTAIGYGSCQPVLQALSMKIVPPERRGAASCTCYIGSDLGAFLGPNIAGALVAAFGYSAMWLAMIVPIVLAFVLIITASTFE